MIKLTGGDFAGRSIHGPPGEGVRPTTSRVRKALFDSLGDIQGLSVLDMFSGTGALGLESLSRGAARAVYVDQNAETIQLNISKLGVSKSSRVLEMEAARALDLLEKEGVFFDLILMDPPWGQGQALLPRAWGLLRPGGRLMLEFATRRPVPAPAQMPEGRLKTYGDTSLIIFQREGGSRS